MANGTTLTVVTRGDKNYKQSVTATDAGDPGAGSVQVLYDDNEPQRNIIKALKDAIRHVTERHTKR